MIFKKKSFAAFGPSQSGSSPSKTRKYSRKNQRVAYLSYARLKIKISILGNNPKVYENEYGPQIQWNIVLYRLRKNHEIPLHQMKVRNEIKTKGWANFTPFKSKRIMNIFSVEYFYSNYLYKFSKTWFIIMINIQKLVKPCPFQKFMRIYRRNK